MPLESEFFNRAHVISELVVYAIAIGFAGMGTMALCRPGFIVSFFGAQASTADFRNEIRAVYGGFGLALACVLLWRDPLVVAGIRLAVACALLGMAGGRIISFLIERSGRWPIVFLIVELAAGQALLAAA